MFDRLNSSQDMSDFHRIFVYLFFDKLFEFDIESLGSMFYNYNLHTSSEIDSLQKPENPLRTGYKTLRNRNLSKIL